MISESFKRTRSKSFFSSFAIISSCVSLLHQKSAGAKRSSKEPRAPKGGNLPSWGYADPRLLQPIINEKNTKKVRQNRTAVVSFRNKAVLSEKNGAKRVDTFHPDQIPDRQIKAISRAIFSAISMTSRLHSKTVERDIGKSLVIRNHPTRRKK